MSKEEKPTAKKAYTWINKYNKKLDAEFFELAERGMSLTQIAYALKIPKKTLLKWSVDKKKKSFIRSFEASKEACQAYHENLLAMMIDGTEKVSAKQIDAQITKLKTMFKDDWAVTDKKEVEVTNKVEAMSDSELQANLQKLLNSEGTRQYMKEIVQKGFKPNLKSVDSEDE